MRPIQSTGTVVLSQWRGMAEHHSFVVHIDIYGITSIITAKCHLITDSGT